MSQNARLQSPSVATFSCAEGHGLHSLQSVLNSAVHPDTTTFFTGTGGDMAPGFAGLEGPRVKAEASPTRTVATPGSGRASLAWKRRRAAPSRRPVSVTVHHNLIALLQSDSPSVYAATASCG